MRFPPLPPPNATPAPPPQAFERVVGFDTETLANRVRRGHVGLRSLAGLVHDAGGAIEIRSLPGVGTRVEVRVSG